MPKGPKGEKRPADVIGTAVKVAKIATGEVEDDTGDAAKIMEVYMRSHPRAHIPTEKPMDISLMGLIGLRQNKAGDA